MHTSEVSRLRQAARASESALVQRGFAAKELEWVQEQDVPDLDSQDSACPFTAAVTQSEGMSEEALARWMDSVPTAGQAGLQTQDQADEAPKRRKVCSAAETVHRESLEILWHIASGGVFLTRVLHSSGRHAPATNAWHARDSLRVCRCSQVWMWRVPKPGPAALRALSCGLTALQSTRTAARLPQEPVPRSADRARTACL